MSEKVAVQDSMECAVVQEHPVWSVLRKEKYTEDFIPQAEAMYDFIKAVVGMCGNVTVEGDTVPTMKVFYNMWNNYSSEVFRMLGFLTSQDEGIK